MAAMVDLAVEKLNEAFDWIKTQVKAFLKLLSEKFVEALLGLKSLVLSCWDKLRRVLAELNGNKTEEEAVVQNESGTMEELQKLVQKMGSTVMEVDKLKSLVDFVEGLIEVVMLLREQPLKPLLVFLDEYLIFRKGKNMKNANFPKPKGKAAMFMRTLIAVPNTFFATA